MLSFLLACLRSDLSGGGGGGPFDITGVNLTQERAGTSCAVPMRLNVSLAYTGSTSGVTLKVERSFNGGDYESIATGLTPESFPYVMEIPAYYNKFGTMVDTIALVTQDDDPTVSRASHAYARTVNLCGI